MRSANIGNIQHETLGNIWFAANEVGLIAIDFPIEKQAFLDKFAISPIEQPNNHMEKIRQQLIEYFDGQRKTFELPIDWSIFREFQANALRATYAIPYGETRTYKQVAEIVGSPNGARAVGRAEATNAIPIVIPCHRVLGSKGDLHGYGAGAGTSTKQWLLDLERNNKEK